MFNVSYVVGVDNINLPSPLFPTFFVPYEKGFRVDVPQGANGEFQLELVYDCHLKSISISATGYNDGDNWNLYADADTIFETIYMKELGESKVLSTHPVLESGTIIKFEFNNSGPAKVVFVDLGFLK